MSLPYLAPRLRNFESLLNQYDGRQPLAKFLSGFFKEHRQMGSKDRRILSGWLYHYFRLGKSLNSLPPLERLAIAEFLCSDDSQVAQVVNPDWVLDTGWTMDRKIQAVESRFPGFQQEVFPLLSLVSEAVDRSSFLTSLWRQPSLFIRVHPGRMKTVLSCLDKQEISYEILEGECLALANGTSLDRFPAIRGMFEVQDRSSQRTAAYFQAKRGESWWDACAASGGKSLLLWHTSPEISLLVSDVRPSVLRNLDERFERAGIKQYRRKILDLTKSPSGILGEEHFDGILLDVPCSGSGTWGRTPEMMQSFSKGKLTDFVSLQRNILSNVVPHLKVGGTLVYITCSVYRLENEEQVAFVETLGCRLERMEVLTGYEYRADTMFVARLIKDNA